jgi:hypothetical protein
LFITGTQMCAGVLFCGSFGWQQMFLDGGRFQKPRAKFGVFA